MATSYLVPIISWLPKGFSCTFVMPPSALIDYLRSEGGEIEQFWRILAGGEVINEGKSSIIIRERKVVSAPEQSYVSEQALENGWPDDGGILEFGLRSPNNEPVFTRTTHPSFYTVYSSPNDKGFITCHRRKFGSPPVISQIATFGKYVDAYPIIHIDRKRNLGDSIVLVNPYKNPALAQFLSSDGQRPKRKNVPAMSALKVDLAELLAANQDEWIGQIQLTASNRLITYIVKHALSDPNTISSVEHLDPFRSDPTHIPVTLWLRAQFGEWRKRRAKLKIQK